MIKKLKKKNEIGKGKLIYEHLRVLHHVIHLII